MTDIWMNKNAPRARVVCRANTALMMEEAVRAGIGVGHLAAFGADRADSLIRPPDSSLDLDIWLLTPRPLRRSARVRSFTDLLAIKLRAQRDLIDGQSVPR